MNIGEVQKSFLLKKALHEAQIKAFSQEELLCLHTKIREAFLSKTFAEHLAKSGFIFKEAPSVTQSEKREEASYCVIGIDGSQIYPSRHISPLKAGLIKISAVIFDYTKENSATFEARTKQEVIFNDDLELEFGTDIFPCNNVFDCLRHLQELRMAVQLAKEFRARPYWQNTVILLDAALNLTFLHNFSEKLGQIFLAHYATLFQELQSLDIAICSYTSWPSNSSICRSLKNFFCKANYFSKNKCLGDCGDFLCKYLSSKNDAELFTYILQEGEQGVTLQQTYLKEFCCQAILTPFFYLATKGEIACVNFLESEYFKSDTRFFTKILLDQIKKGFGYPLALTEAHASADITSAEKALFINLLNNQIDFSPKLCGKKNLFG